MTCRFVLGVFVGFLAAAHSGTYAQDRSGSDDAAAAAKKLEGNWKLVRAEAGGQAQLAGLRKEGLFIEEGKIFWTEDGRERGGQKGDLEIDPSTKPKSFVVEITRGSLIGQKLLAIYEINGKKLNICWSEPDAKKQPTRFVTKTSTGAGARLETYELVDDDDSTASEGTTSKNGSGKVDVAAETKKLEGNWKLTSARNTRGTSGPAPAKTGYSSRRARSSGPTMDRNAAARKATSPSTPRPARSRLKSRLRAAARSARSCWASMRSKATN